jgi:microcin C transport system substrate-binding protein
MDYSPICSRSGAHDGSPLTAHDVAFSLKVLKDKGHPIAQQLLRDLVDAEASDDATMVVRFAPNRARDVPLFAASLPIFSRSYYSKRPFDETTLEVPLGSGPYKVGRFEPGRHIEYERVKDWWGADLPVARGQNNFDIVRYEYYRDRDVAFEGFAAKSYLFREEFTSRTWATRYDFPAARDGRIKRDVISDDTPSGAQGWLPDEVFGDPFVPPVSDGSGQDRVLLRKASALLQQAGFVIKDGKRVTPNGERISVEFLLDGPSLQPHHMPFIKNLGALGIEANLRLVDPVQYRKRVDDFDFDLTVQRFSFSSTPGDSLRSYFSSQAAALRGSQNLAGISDPVIDELIDKIIAADSRASLTTACKVLDRVIRTGRYWVPHWYKASHWLAYWDVFGRPATKPRYARGIPETWWHDREKAAKIDQ